MNSQLSNENVDGMHELTKSWWLFLVTGIAWIVFAFVVLSFNITTVWAVAVFAGFGFIGGGILELATASVAPSWKWLHVVFGLISIAAGVVALVWPGETFLVLAAIIGWYVLFAGIVEVIASFMAREENDLWWLGLILGLAQVAIGFWAVGYAGRSIALLVVWVGATALARGISSIFMAFGLHHAGKQLRSAMA